MAVEMGESVFDEIGQKSTVAGNARKNANKAKGIKIGIIAAVCVVVIIVIGVAVVQSGKAAVYESLAGKTFAYLSKQNGELWDEMTITFSEDGKSAVYTSQVRWEDNPTTSYYTCEVKNKSTITLALRNGVAFDYRLDKREDGKMALTQINRSENGRVTDSYTVHEQDVYVEV